MSIVKLSPSEMYEFITRALATRQVPYVAGPPAIGKSQVVYQVAKDAKAKMIDLRLSQILSEDMTGLPERNEKTGKAYYLPFETFPLEGDDLPDGYNGWLLFLDELSSATEEVLAAAYSLILDRTVGGKKLHKKCLVVAAGNRASDSAIARALPDTLITRMLPAEMKVSTNDWLVWAETEPNINEAIVGFIEKNPTKLYAHIDQKNREELETYATPRGWEKAMAHVNQHEALCQENYIAPTDAAGIPIQSDPDEKHLMPIDDITFHLICSAVGPMAAQEFREEYDEAIQLPYPWEIAQSPNSTRIPSSGVGKAKITTDLSKYFMESDQQSRDAVLSYVNRMGGEYAELFVNQMSKTLGDTPSEKKLLELVSKRLSIDPLLGGVKGGSGSDPDSPFFKGTRYITPT